MIPANLANALTVLDAAIGSAAADPRPEVLTLLVRHVEAGDSGVEKLQMRINLWRHAYAFLEHEVARDQPNWEFAKALHGVWKTAYAWSREPSSS